MLHDEIFNDAKHPVTVVPAKIKRWVSLLHELELSNISNKEIAVCASLWLDKNANIDSKVLQDICHSLMLLSTCYLCQNGNFIGDQNYSNNKFINCLADVAIQSETRERCTSFERREVTDE